MPPNCTKQLDHTILIPARNEASRLPHLLAVMRRQLPAAQIVVIDNASEDGTGEIARDLGAIVVAESRIGKGYALMTGIRLLDAPIVFCCDADVRGLTGDMITQAVIAVDHAAAPLVRLAIGRPPTASVVTTFLARPILLALGHACAEPLGGMFACSTRWVRQLTLPGNWSFDIALTLAALEEVSSIPEIRVTGVTHRERPLEDYTGMAHEIGAYLVSYLRRKGPPLTVV